MTAHRSRLHCYIWYCALSTVFVLSWKNIISSGGKDLLFLEISLHHSTSTSPSLTNHLLKLEQKQEEEEEESPPPRILVTFTGPSNKNHTHKYMVELYERNLDFFLKYGMVDSCQDRDTIITVGHEYFDHYYPIVAALDERCQQLADQQLIQDVVADEDVSKLTKRPRPPRHFVRLVARRDVCYDMESVRMVFHGAVGGVPPVATYDYFLYINCGVSGPHPLYAHSWVQKVLQPLITSQQRQQPNSNNNTNNNNTHSTTATEVHMTGLSVNCDQAPHVQSMVFAVDRVGLQVIQGIPFDCVEEMKERTLATWDFVTRYELAMGRAMLEHGYGIQPFLGNLLQDPFDPKQNSTKNNNYYYDEEGPIVTPENAQNCTLLDVWWGHDYMLNRFHGHYPFLNQTIFYKSSRMLPAEVRELIGFDFQG